MKIIIIGFLLASLPWCFAFQKLKQQPLGISVLAKELVRSLAIGLVLFAILYALAMTNNIPKGYNGTGSYRPTEIRQAVYIFIGWVLALNIYISGGIYCYQKARKRALLFKPKKENKPSL